ncbi:DUF1853 family protein [Polaribacter sp. Hel1_85]|uniref:DUF1853 family protein n=1 Tax=Polaribacter sp. Hel1_85 TaxID=1250005 RepID=UPI00052D0845|nr:DUF1853 family protein [Polaribacter sp. Hel1_85]KGL63302.1 hypothetical protein PHEL85_0336 [Polaribacter sp. Hel1_85]
MHQQNKDLQKHYEGFLQTNCLWKDNVVYEILQFDIETKSTKIDIDINEKLRLGKYIERLVSFQLEQEKDISILSENIQIQKEKITLGELDCIIKREEKPIHLEVIYKFYLYDSSVGNTEIEHFIGPNRKDSLVEKLTKLKEKQLPLLYSNECKSFLKTINLTSNKIEQQVYFKGQLFVPFSSKSLQLETLNQDCIVGFYINQKELLEFKNCKFYIPNKKGWIVIPHKNVNWLNYENFQILAQDYIQRKSAPLCWMKKQNGTLIKIFLVWW